MINGFYLPCIRDKVFFKIIVAIGIYFTKDVFAVAWSAPDTTWQSQARD